MFIPPKVMGMFDLLYSSINCCIVELDLDFSFKSVDFWSHSILLSPASIASFPVLFMLLAVTMDMFRIFPLLASMFPSHEQEPILEVIACSCAAWYLPARREVPHTRFPPYTMLFPLCFKKASLACPQITYKHIKHSLLAC